MQRNSYYIINGITMYRLLMAPVLIFLAIKGEREIFKWLLPVSFMTDMVDGFLARRYHVISKFGSFIDSVGDDLTVVAAIVGVFMFNPEFVKEQRPVIYIMLALYCIQNLYALVKFKKISSFHTYMAKVAAILQGTFLILFFLINDVPLWLFYIAAITTILDLVEEIVIVHLLPIWETNVKGIYWILKSRNSN